MSKNMFDQSITIYFGFKEFKPELKSCFEFQTE